MGSGVEFAQDTFQPATQHSPLTRSQSTLATARQPIRLATIDETVASFGLEETCEPDPAREQKLTTMDLDRPDIHTPEKDAASASMASQDGGKAVPLASVMGAQCGAVQFSPATPASGPARITNAYAGPADVKKNNNTSTTATIGPSTSSLSSFLARIPESQKFSSTTLSSRYSSQPSAKPRSAIRVDRPEPIQTLQFSAHSFPISALETVLRSTNAQFRLALMLAIPWRTAAFWSVTGSTLGCFYVARLLLPRLRLYAVFLGRGLASLLAANADGTPISANIASSISDKPAHQPGDAASSPPVASSRAALQRAWLAVLTVANSASSSLTGQNNNNSPSSTSSSASASVSTALITASSLHLHHRPTTPRAIPYPRTPERFSLARSPSSDCELWSPASSNMNDRFNEDGESPARVAGSLANSPSRSRANSAVGKLHTKRFSLNFPIQPPTGPTSRPPSWHASPILSPEILASPTEGKFLTTLAAQERRVLELKEDLRRAEAELERLKRHWAKHEMNKKGQDTRRTVQLQPLKTNFGNISPGQNEPEDLQQKAQREMERRKVLLSGQRQSNRRMFSGSRHTRTLSLLSPDKGQDPQSFTDSPFKKPSSRINLERSSTLPDVKPPSSPTKEDIFADLTGVPREAILRTGKQMVGDIKDGFWTFVEDIRQAAVGNEPINGTPARMNSTVSRQSLNRSRSQRLPVAHDKKLARHSTALITNTQPRTGSQMKYDTSPDPNGFWRENGVESPESTRSRSTVTTVRLENTPTPPEKQKDADEGWDMWATPIRLGNKHGASSSLSSTNTNATHQPHRSDSPSSATSEYEMSKTGTLSSTGPPSPTTTTTLSTPDMSNNIDNQTENIWQKQQTAKTVDPRSMRRTASLLLPDWEKAVAEESRNCDKQD